MLGPLSVWAASAAVPSSISVADAALLIVSSAGMAQGTHNVVRVLGPNPPKLPKEVCVCVRVCCDVNYQSLPAHKGGEPHLHTHATDHMRPHSHTVIHTSNTCTHVPSQEVGHKALGRLAAATQMVILVGTTVLGAVTVALAGQGSQGGGSDMMGLEHLR